MKHPPRTQIISQEDGLKYNLCVLLHILLVPNSDKVLSVGEELCSFSSRAQRLVTSTPWPWTSDFISHYVAFFFNLPSICTLMFYTEPGPSSLVFLQKHVCSCGLVEYKCNFWELTGCSCATFSPQLCTVCVQIHQQEMFQRWQRCLGAVCSPVGTSPTFPSETFCLCSSTSPCILKTPSQLGYDWCGNRYRGCTVLVLSWKRKTV